eukprot:COSAG02_NODE_1644_length_11524_cov_76.342232_3_plen_91_part_00
MTSCAKPPPSPSPSPPLRCACAPLLLLAHMQQPPGKSNRPWLGAAALLALPWSTPPGARMVAPLPVPRAHPAGLGRAASAPNRCLGGTRG